MTLKFQGIDSKIIQTLMQFEPMLFVKGQRLNKKWRDQVHEAIDEYCNPMENNFVATYYEHIFFKKSYTWVKPISFCHERGLRLDRVFICELVAEGPGIK